MKLFLTGASGLVGAQVARVAARRGHEVHGVVGRWPGTIPGAAALRPLDLADCDAVQRAVLDLFPDVIINAAALSEPADCDADPERSWQVNVALPAALAQLAHHLGARLVHLSSEQVFDGTHAPYRRDDPVRPVNRYGRQKVESEELVTRHAPEHAVTVRLPLLGGNSPGGRRSLHERLFAAWAAGRPTRLFRDEVRQPCSAENVAELLVELGERRDLRGVLHWAGAAPLTRLAMGRRIAEHFRIPAERFIIEAGRTDEPATALRPPDLSLDCAPLTGCAKTRPESFDALLEKLIVPAPCQAWYRQLA